MRLNIRSGDSEIGTGACIVGKIIKGRMKCAEHLPQLGWEDCLNRPEKDRGSRKVERKG